MKSYKLLKKSYVTRKLLDIISSSLHVVIIHLDKLKNLSLYNIRKNLKNFNIKSYIINKDDFLSLSLSSVSYGNTILFYSLDFFFLETLKKLFKINDLKFNVNYIKFFYPISDYYMNQFVVKNLIFNINNVYAFFFFLLNFYKNLINILYYVLFKNLIFLKFLLFNELNNFFFLFKYFKNKNDNI